MYWSSKIKCTGVPREGCEMLDPGKHSGVERKKYCIHDCKERDKAASCVQKMIS